MANWKGTITRFLLRIFNIIYGITQYFGWELIPVTIDDIVEPLTPEERQEVLQQDFSEPIRLIVEACNKPGNSITGFQRFAFLDMIRFHIKTRTAVKMEVARNPDILNTPVDGPLVIIGLARSGTTMLQRLLACDPQFLSPMSWEMFKPTPAGRPTNWKESERYKEATKIYKQMIALMPEDFRAIHNFGLDTHEECLLILASCFLNISESIHPELTNWRQFQMECPKEYLRKTYDYYKMALQCLFYKNLYGGKKLLLKCPLHALYINTYRQVFPNAKFIFTYRHLGTMFASSCSLMKQMVKMQAMELDHQLVKNQCLDLYKLTCKAVVDEFQQMSKDSFITMGYTEIMKDPMAAVKSIYSHFKLELTPEVEASMQRHIVDNHQHKFGTHEYNKDLGVSLDDQKEHFKEFLEYFKDKPEIFI